MNNRTVYDIVDNGVMSYTMFYGVMIVDMIDWQYAMKIKVIEGCSTYNVITHEYCYVFHDNIYNMSIKQQSETFLIKYVFMHARNEKYYLYL